jgi:hypothetical protein
MDKKPSPETNTAASATPEPETLVARTDDGTPESGAATPPPAVPSGPAQVGKFHHKRTYRPSHKATFLGLAAVIAILTINAAVLAFVLKGKNQSNNQSSDQVTISKAALSKVGVNSNSVGDSGVVLTIGPSTEFKSKVVVAGDVSVGGQLKLNSKFTASEASITQLEAGKVSFSDLNVSGNGTLNNLNLRNGLVVTGSSQLQGPVTANQLVTLNNSLIVIGNISVGGTFSAKTFSASSLTSTGTLSIGGHVVTSGQSPSIGKGGSALGNNGTVSISGNDAAGTIAINIGTGAGTGTLANIAFKTQYASPPRVVITPVGAACTFYVLNLTVAGFSVGDGCNLPPGGYALNYIVMQ